MSYIGNAPVVVPVERQVSGVNVGTIVAFPSNHPAPVGYVQSGAKFSKSTYPELFKYLNSETAPNVDNDQVGDIKWFANRELLDGDYIPADGQMVSGGIKQLPEMWDAIRNKKVPVVTEEEFTSDAHKRGSYTEGDGSGGFRVPDMNGVSSNTLGSVFLRGYGGNAEPTGMIQGDAIRNITAKFFTTFPTSSSMQIFRGHEGAFYATKFNYGDNQSVDPNAGAYEGATNEVFFDASRVVSTAPENRPINIAGCWAVRVKRSKIYYIKAAGFIENEGLAKIGGLVETDARLQKQIDDILNKPLLYAEGWVASSIPADSSIYPQSYEVVTSYGITASADNSKYTVSRDGVYKIGLGITKDGGTHQMLQIFIDFFRKGADTPWSSRRLALNYNGTLPTTEAVQGAWITTSGEAFIKLESGESVSPRVDATNGLVGKLYGVGHFTIEYLRP